MLNKDCQAGTNAEQSKNDETQLPSSHNNGNTLVVCRLSTLRKRLSRFFEYLCSEDAYLQSRFFWAWFGELAFRSGLLYLIDLFLVRP